MFFFYNAKTYSDASENLGVVSRKCDHFDPALSDVYLHHY